MKLIWYYAHVSTTNGEEYLLGCDEDGGTGDVHVLKISKDFGYKEVFKNERAN